MVGASVRQVQARSKPGSTMPHAYRRTQKELATYVQDHFGLTEPEALVCLNDVVKNLEALVADLLPREDVRIDPARSQERIMHTLEALSAQLPCPPLADLVAALKEAGAAGGGPLPDQALEPLSAFVQGLRRAMPPTPQDQGE